MDSMQGRSLGSEPIEDRRTRALVILGAIVGLALLRLVPHPPNFTPAAAMALFAGARFERKSWAFLTPLAAMLVSDLLLEAWTGDGLHALMPVVYGCLAVVVLIGSVLRDRTTVARLAGAAVGASALFFLVTNLVIWLAGDPYPRSIEGLIACYVAALPFLDNNVLGDLIYTAVIFGVWHLAKRRWPVLDADRTRAIALSA
jgi:hypothetical protein